MEGYNVVVDQTICSGYRTLADKLDEVVMELDTQQKSALLATLNQAWAVVERRQKERRSHV